MTEFMIELYAPSADGAVVAEAAARLARQIEVVRSIFVAEDETCFVFVKAAGVGDVHAAAARAHIELERVVKTTFDTGEQPILRGEP
jgi:hypothetical protein